MTLRCGCRGLIAGILILVYVVASSASGPRDHGPAPAYEEWSVLDEQKLEQKDGIWNAVISADGKTLATASNKFLKLWDLSAEKAREKATLNIRGRSTALRFSPDGKTLFLGLPDHTLRLLDVSGKRMTERMRMSDWAKNVWYITFSPDGKILAVARRKAVHLLDVTENGFTEWMKLDRHSKPARAVNFSPDGKLLATAGQEGKIMLWKVGLDKPILVKQRAGAFSEVFFVPQSKDVRLIACNWNYGTIYLFKVGK